MKKLILQSFFSIVFALAYTSALQAHCGHCGVTNDTPAHDGSKVKVWTCPMHPEVQMDKPGKCPKCGLDLVPAK